MTDSAPAPPAPDSGQTLGTRIVRASAMVMLAHVIFKFLGLIQTALVGRFCDTVTAELFVFGYDHILLLFFLIGEEAIAPALLPIFMEQREKHGDARAWRLAGNVMSWQFLLALAAAGLIMLFPDVAVRAFTDWESKPEYMARAPGYARWMAASIVFMGMSTSTYMILNGYKRFFLAALGDAFVKIGVIGGLLAGVGYAALELGGREFFASRLALAALAGGSLFGCALKLLVHLWGLRRELTLFRPGLSFSNPAFRRFLTLVLPLLAGILFAKGRDLYNNLYILSGLEDGLVKANAWGGKIFKSAGMLAPFAVSIALLPYLCEMVDRDRKEELGRTVDAASRLLFLFFLPLAAFLMVVSLPLAVVLYGGGRFTYEDCLRSALSNACYAWVLPFYAVEYVFIRAFFSQRRTLAVALWGVGASAVMIAANTAGILLLGAAGTEALAVVALSYSVTRAIKVIGLGALLSKSIPCFAWRETAAFVWRVFGVALAGGAAAWAARKGYEAIIPLDALFAGNGASAAAGGAFGRAGRLALAPLGDLCVSGLAWLTASGLAAWWLARAECLLAWNYAAHGLRRRRNPSARH